MKLKDEYYVKTIEELENKKKEISNFLKHNNFDNDRELLVNKSQQYFQAYLVKKFLGKERIKFISDNYNSDVQFKKFINEYPVILSTTHAINNSKSNNFIFDYIIFDEAS